MNPWLSALLEILKLTIPSIVIFLTIYALMREYLQKDYEKKVLEFKQSKYNITIPMRLAAYERLSLFVERISIPNLLMRVRTDEMSAKELQISMILSLQQEYEHNLSQQVYISPQLWEIIRHAQTEVVNTIHAVAKEMGPSSTASDFQQALFKQLASSEKSAMDTALLAIKKEAGLLI